jgi:16S rRNA (cytidine1402-2'-O)-methyltransferase
MTISVIAPATLYVVATPIGNLGDITPRARDVLSGVHAIAAEDTRVTRDLLRLLNINAPPLFSIREHNEAQAANGIVALLAQGQSVAYASDAGTPGVSDPGARLVAAVREAGFSISPIPGVSAVTALLSASGLVSDAFTFFGFVPHGKSDADAFIETLDACAHIAVFFESTHRIAATADKLALACPARNIVVGKELTKKFETLASMPCSQFPAWLAADAQRVKGEFVLALAPRAAAAAAPNVEDAKRWLDALAKELPPARAAKIVSKMTGVSRDVLYRGIAVTED